jgi:hypothetical protein
VIEWRRIHVIDTFRAGSSKGEAMRRLVPVLVCLLLGVLATQNASAEPRVGPPLDVYIQVERISDSPETATLEIAGRQCLPEDAPASVLVTVDQFPDQVFTATPNASGRWYVSIPIPVPVEQTYVVNAECDNYFGTTVYPQAEAGPDDIIYVVGEVSGTATGSGGGVTPPIAVTGTRTAAELEAGVAALVIGSLFIWLGRRRREVDE